MSLREALVKTIQTYEAIAKELEDYKSNEYKQGVAEGLTLVLEAVKADIASYDE